MFKKLGILLFVLSALLIIPLSANAAETVDSGICGKEGDNLAWTIDSDGTLTISGTGDMAEYDYFNVVPWQNYIYEISNVIIAFSAYHPSPSLPTAAI